MKVITVSYAIDSLPDRFTGVVIFRDRPYRAEYFQNGERHRIDGAAVKEYEDGMGKKSEGFFLQGVYYKTKEDWFDALTDDEKVKAIFNIDEWGQSK